MVHGASTSNISAAFDTMDHTILHDVLHYNFGVQGLALDWFTSYLTERSFKVVINNSVSSPREFVCSVPQGSVAGPVLYTVYASTLPSAIRYSTVSIVGYADDHGIYRSFSPRRHLNESVNMNALQNCIRDIKIWMDHNRLKMNQSKTELIYFGSKQQLDRCQITPMTLDQCSVERSNVIRCLGVYLDDTLSFSKHISIKCQVAAANILRIKNFRKYLTLKSTKQISHVLVISHYCCLIFFGLPAYQMNRLQKLQNWAAKVALDRHRRDSGIAALRDLKWLPIKYCI